MRRSYWLLLSYWILLAMTLAAPVLVAPPAAQAEPYKWCAIYGSGMGGAKNCGFVTIEQCRLTVSGLGGFCEPNLFYTGPADETPARRGRRGRDY